MDYTKYQYLWPPRPNNAIQSSFLNFYEKRDWVAQYKKNGTCNVLFVSPDKAITAMNRHNEEHRAWKPSDASNELFEQLPGDGWHVFVTEVLNNKVPGIRDTHYIFDILVHNGTYLLGSTFVERQELLKKMFLTGAEKEEYSHYVLNDNVWLAKTITSNFKSLYDEVINLERKADEGLVVKNPNAKLELCNKQSSNNGWQFKCRIQHKNYSF